MSNIFDKFSLKDRTAIVTGGAGLLGKEFCQTLAQAGALVVVADLNETAAQQVAETLNREGLRACAVGVDVTDPESVRGMVSAALDLTGRVDVLVNSAAMDPKFDSSQQGQHSNAFEDYPVDAWRQALDVNLTGMFLCCQAVARPMVAQDYGSIINICSTYGLVGPDQRLYERPGQPPQFKPVFYSVTKSGVLGMTRLPGDLFCREECACKFPDPGRRLQQP